LFTDVGGFLKWSGVRSVNKKRIEGYFQVTTSSTSVLAN
jgi:hypothetical protein